MRPRRERTPRRALARLLSGRFPLVVTGTLFLFLVAVYVVVLLALSPQRPGAELAYDEFFADVDTGHVHQPVTLLSYDSIATGRLDDGRRYWVSFGGGGGTTGDQVFNSIIGTLLAKRVHFTIDAQSTKRLLGLATQFALPSATLVTGFAFIFLLFRGASADLSGLGRSRARRYAAPHETITFADVAGMDEAVEELREVKDALSAPELFSALGARSPRGVLLVGPPGCGKTLLARAVAGEAGVPFYSLSGSEFTEMLVGVGPARVRDLFRQARATAPSIVFIDELDAIGRARSSGETLNPEWEATLNELLVQLDGFDAATAMVLMAATNRPDVLDQALLRKGRFDRQIVIDVPDRAGREAIFAVHATGKPVAPDVDWPTVLSRTVGFTGADVAAVMNEAALLATRRRLQEIGRPEISEAIDRIIAGPERRSRILMPDERRRAAYHESGHALIGWLLPGSVTVDKVSLVARGHSLGSTWNRAADDRRLVTRRQIEDEITMALAGRAAEQLVFDDPSSAAQSDLQRATLLAGRMVRELGMSAALGPLVLGAPDSTGGREHSYELVARADGEILRILQQAEERAARTLSTHRAALDTLTAELLQRETLERPDLVQLLGSLAPAPVPERTLDERGDRGDDAVARVV